MLRAAGDEEWGVRQAAMMALGGLGASLATQPEALKAVLRAAGDEEEYVRKAAIAALGGLGASLASLPEAFNAVLRAAGDKDGVSGGGDSGVRWTGRESG